MHQVMKLPLKSYLLQTGTCQPCTPFCTGLTAKPKAALLASQESLRYCQLLQKDRM